MSFTLFPLCYSFRSSEKGAHLFVPQESQLYIICPSVALIGTVEETMTDQENMYENMYLCTKEEFDRYIFLSSLPSVPRECSKQRKCYKGPSRKCYRRKSDVFGPCPGCKESIKPGVVANEIVQNEP